jgi:fructan beta-fructosidase
VCLHLAALSFGRPDVCAADDPGVSYREPWRPQFHFTPARNWMNDPNGMVFYDGEFHLFYQYNPFGDKWGHMSWGHAVSPDLVHWEHLPVALLEEGGVMVFSGSAVMDTKNTSGFGEDGKPPLVAIYTGHYTEKPLQNQHIAYSNDRGRTWTKYAGNPVLDIGEKDFRDPKVFWHESTRQWVMVVSLPVERKVSFYGSPNLKEWTHLGYFGPAGAVKGIWECPDLFPLRVERREGASPGTREKWVLIVNIGGDSVAGGSGCQYFVGEFNGRNFEPDPIPDPPVRSAVESANWVDYGKDFYAAVSWSNVPKRDGRRLWVGWMSNWEYANDVPTAPWRSAMSIPRALSLRKLEDRWLLLQSPVKELKKLRAQRVRVRSRKSGLGSVWRHAAPETYEWLADMRPSEDAVFNLRLGQGDNEETVLRVDVPARRLTLDRTRSGRTDFHARFPGTYQAPVRLIRGTLKLQIFVDTSSLEVFANDGETVLTSLIFPAPDARGLELFLERGELRRANMDLFELQSIWR